MFRIKPMQKGERGARRAELYFEKTDSGYYEASEELHTEWIGEGATRLSLKGKPPDYEHFKRLLRGLDPWSGEQLTARLRDDRLAGWDLVVSMPKGATEAVRRDPRARGAFFESMREAFAIVEGYATTRVRMEGVQEDRLTGNLMGYFVEHPDTRPVVNDWLPADHPWRVMPLPDRHGHIVVPNETFDPVEERWKAVKFRPIMDLRTYFDRCFDGIFAYKLSELGYPIETKFKQDRKGNPKYYSWDIAGMPASYLKTISKRSEEIDQLEQNIVAERQLEDPYAPDHLSSVEKDRLGATSRRTKRDDLTLAECNAFWETLPTEEERAAIEDVIYRAQHGLNPRPENRAGIAAEFSMRHHFEKESAVRMEDLVATALEQSMGTARPEMIEQELKRRGVIVVRRDGKWLATTAELDREEQGLAGYAAAGLGAVQAIGVPEGLSRKLSTGETLSHGQWEAAGGLLASENRINLVQGPAGAGKSKLLRKFDEGARLAGENVTYLGTTSTSVRVLKDDGFKADTLARFLLDQKMQAAARGGRVVIDETSILGHVDAVKLFEVARSHDLKLIFVGDPMQHGSIGRGAFMRLLTDYGDIKPFRLTEILRQKDPAYQAAAQLMSEGRAAEGFDALDRLGWVSEMTNGKDRYTHMAADYVQALADGVAWNDVLVIAPTHRESGFITQEIRNQLREVGKLGSEERSFTRLVQVDASEAQRGLATTYRTGDVLEFHQNAKGGFVKGRRYEVTDPEKVPLSEANKFLLYRPEEITLAVGDVLRFTGKVRNLSDGHLIKNGETHTVAGFTETGNLKLDSGQVIAADAGHFRRGFVETSVGSQGRTVRRVILGMSTAAGRGAINMQQMYVSASRASEQMRIYTDAKDDVREDIQRDSRKLLALDLRATKPAANARADEARQQMERQRRRSFAQRMRSKWDRFRAMRNRAVAWSLPATATPHAERVRKRERENGAGYER